MNTIFIVETLLVAAASIVPWGLAAITALKRLDRDLLHPVPTELTSWLTRSTVIILLLIYIALNQPARLESIGLFWPVPAEGIGILNAVTAVVLFGMVLSGIGLLPLALYTTFVRRVLRKELDLLRSQREWFSKFSRPWERFGLLVCLLLGAVAEELVFRGYLVLLLGERTGAWLLCAVISVALCASIHLPYGFSMIPYYVWHAAFLTWLSWSTGNVVWAITAHCSGNIVAAITSWRVIGRTTEGHSSQILDSKPSG